MRPMPRSFGGAGRTRPVRPTVPPGAPGDQRPHRLPRRSQAGAQARCACCPEAKRRCPQRRPNPQATQARNLCWKLFRCRYLHSCHKPRPTSPRPWRNDNARCSGRCTKGLRHPGLDPPRKHSRGCARAPRCSPPAGDQRSSKAGRSSPQGCPTFARGSPAAFEGLCKTLSTPPPCHPRAAKNPRNPAASAPTSCCTRQRAPQPPRRRDASP
mmetsp:Transcript_55732/g.155331  ORF Transcript_55732/g.155331 Transcript_55732/m.155331 type:complete len:212 (+) Transcript_55732:1739-2374(+)